MKILSKISVVGLTVFTLLGFYGCKKNGNVAVDSQKASSYSEIQLVYTVTDILQI